jgi:hypothetical protein
MIEDIGLLGARDKAAVDEESGRSVDPELLALGFVLVDLLGVLRLVEAGVEFSSNKTWALRGELEVCGREPSRSANGSSG